MKITHNSKRASSKSIAEAINENKLPRLSHGILDSETTIVIHGCGVGNDVELLASVGEVFASESAIPVVNASKFFESYASSFDVQGQRHERYLTRSWMLTYPMDNAPQIQTLANAFRDKYSSSEIDWTGALNRLKPRWPGDEYTFTFEVPVKFTIPLQDESFSFNTLGDKMKFLSECPEVIDALKEIDMCTEDFSWSFSPAYITNKDGQRLSAVWIKGYATVHTVLKDIVASSNSEEVASIKPFSAQLSDPRYYASSSQKSN
jgi:hypothetical protein